MVCIYCLTKTKTTNSRTTRSGHQVWRRRGCPACHAVFTTRESAALSDAVRVKTAQKALEPFNPDKLLISLYMSLSHRKTALEDAGQLRETAIDMLLPIIKNGVIATSSIAGCLQNMLERFDHAAGVYYKAHYSSKA